MKLGPYEIVAPVGVGGMGEVYRAIDARLGRTVAIKILLTQSSGSAELKERFDREARAISKLNHPNICVLYDIGHQDGIDYLVMEYLDGETLADALARGPLPLPQVLRIGAEIANAIDRAHRDGIVHRDLKPGNIMLTRSGAKVLDFGLAKEAPTLLGADDATARMALTAKGTIVGTLQYMAPEQLEARPADSRTDLFALGAILYEMTTGHRAFDGASPASIITAIMSRDPEPMSARIPMAPPLLDQLVRRCLAKRQDDRLQSAHDLSIALQDLHDETASLLRSGFSSSPNSNLLAIQPPRVDRRRTFFIAASIAAALLLGVSGWLIGRSRKSTSLVSSARTVAVLPFATLGVDNAHTYLGVALPDEITTILSNSHNLSVRPFSATRHFGAETDPQEAARKLDVGGIISGHLLAEGERLSITLEAIDVSENKLLWRDVFDSPASDLLSIRRELSTRIQNNLLPKLAGGTATPEQSQPTSGEAYALYLRATVASTDPAPNKEAVAMLQRAVTLDPKFALAWEALAQREYFDFSFSNGGPAALARMQEAAKRALAIDPDRVNPALRLISMNAENGRITDAYHDAVALVRRRPDSADAHFTLSYVMRYGGALREAADECDRAWAIDHGNRSARSCAIVFMGLGNYDRALEFTRVDGGTEWANRITGNIYLRQGKYQEAADLVSGPRQALIRAAVNHDRNEVDRVADRLLAASQSSTDGEPLYFIGNVVSMGGDPQKGLGLLREAVRRNYCSYPAVETDPLWAPARALPEYAEVRRSAQACHEVFMKELAK
jgi:serine/threonine protein kinase